MNKIDNLTITHSPERERELQELCKQVLNTSPNCWDNPNGAYETTCPFCYETEYRGGGGSIWAAMHEIKHQPDCAYNIAKGLSTNI